MRCGMIMPGNMFNNGLKEPLIIQISGCFWIVSHWNLNNGNFEKEI
jgi:hypothetical protein